MSSMTPDRWAARIHRGQRHALRKYGHLSRDEIVALGQRGKISRPLAEFLLAASRGTEAS